MELIGKISIPASADIVWNALNDPEILKRCLPGCETIDIVSPTEFVAKLHVKVGPIAARLFAKVRLQNIDPLRSYTLVSECNGGPVGMVSGTANVQLQKEGDGTLLQYQTNAKISGKLAQIGSRLIDGFANKTAAEFFARLTDIIAAGVAVAQRDEANSLQQSPDSKHSEDEEKGFLSRLAFGGKRNQ
jgi:carbon monoxide dehydrogenase subunit G